MISEFLRPLAVAADGNCSLLSSGAAQCTGLNPTGTLGNGTNSDSSIPVPMTGIGTAIAITAGQIYNCAMLRSGVVKCWGYNADGQLENGPTTDSNTPVPVGAISKPTRLAAGLFHTRALLEDGQ